MELDNFDEITRPYGLESLAELDIAHTHAEPVYEARVIVELGRETLNQLNAEAERVAMTPASLVRQMIERRLEIRLKAGL